MRRFPFVPTIIAALILPLLARGDGLSWPSKQFLPRFAKPAATLDCIDLSDSSGGEVDLCASLEGIVNRTQPRIACVTGRRGDERAWLDLHHLLYQMVKPDDAVLKYRASVKGLVVTDPDLADTLNVATTIAGVKDELICDPDLLAKLTNAPFNLPIVDDLRGRFADKYAAYGYLRSNYWDRCTHRIFAGMGLRLHGSLRDYLVAVKSAVVWLGPGTERDAALLRSFVQDMKPVGGVYMGWWPGEGDGLNWIAQYGIPVLASDFFCNGTVFSGVTSSIEVPPIPPPPKLENKIYVAMILSDGDNVQYMQHTMKRDWDSAARGTIPIGWTASPLAVDLDPAMLNHYWTTATTNDCLISGPSGAGYAHINVWKPDYITSFAKVSAPYLKRSGLRVITVWDRVNDTVADAYSRDCPTLLGLTDQSGDYSSLTHGLRTIKLTPTYTSTVRELVEYIEKAAAGWNGSRPLFIAAQADVWNMSPASLVRAARRLDSKKYVLVRPDQLFMLASQANPPAR